MTDVADATIVAGALALVAATGRVLFAAWRGFLHICPNAAFIARNAPH